MKIPNFFGICLLLVSASATAAGDQNITAVSKQIQVNSLTFYSNISGMAIHLLFMLFGIAFAVKAINMTLKRAEFQEMVVSMVKMMMAVSVYVLFIEKGSWFLAAIVDSAKLMGSTGAGIPAEQLNPGAIMSLGIHLQDEMVRNFNERTNADTFLGALTHFFPAMMMMVGCLVVLFGFAMVAFTLFLTYCEMYLLIAIAPFMFAMGGLEWTKDNALKPFQSMIAVSVKIMIVALVAKIAISSAPVWTDQLAQWQMGDWIPMWEVAFQILSVGVLALLAPKLATAAMSGGSSMSAADALQAGGNVGSMVTGAGTMALGAAAAASSGAGTVTDYLGKAVGGDGTPDGAGRAVGGAMRSMMEGGNTNRVLDPGSGDGLSPAPSGTSSSVGLEPTQTTSTGKGDATGASISGNAGGNAAVTKQDLQAAFQDAEKQNKPGVMDKVRQIPDYVPNEGMVSGAAVSHVNLD